MSRPAWSSGLHAARVTPSPSRVRRARSAKKRSAKGSRRSTAAAISRSVPDRSATRQRPLQQGGEDHHFRARLLEHVERGDDGLGLRRRSEEHTSELQSLMRISYAVFCLKKKKPNMPTTMI